MARKRTACTFCSYTQSSCQWVDGQDICTTCTAGRRGYRGIKPKGQGAFCNKPIPAGQENRHSGGLRAEKLRTFQLELRDSTTRAEGLPGDSNINPLQTHQPTCNYCYGDSNECNLVEGQDICQTCAGYMASVLSDKLVPVPFAILHQGELRAKRLRDDEPKLAGTKRSQVWPEVPSAAKVAPNPDASSSQTHQPIDEQALVQLTNDQLHIRDLYAPDVEDLQQMALYNLNQARRIMDNLAYKMGKWTRQDTASFDCMHYLGDSALDHAAHQLGLRTGDVVLDVGSGYGSTGRYLHEKFGVDVAGIEIQAELHKIANRINEKAGMNPSRVWSYEYDFLTLQEGPSANQYDAMISLLTILHIPNRRAVWAQAASMVRQGGKIYIEDYYDKCFLTADEAATVERAVCCPYLPTRAEYLQEMQEAGFGKFQFEDVTDKWRVFTGRRARTYRESDVVEEPLARFYDEVARLFSGGYLGGCRITAEHLKTA